MLERLDRVVRERFVVVACLVLVAAYLAKYSLIVAFGTNGTPTIQLLTLSEETLWVVLQPLGVLVYSVRHWRAMSQSQRLASLAWFWLPVTFLIAVFAKKLAIVGYEGIGLAQCEKYDITLELLWVYFPVAGTLSWYIRRWRHASPAEKWRCERVFTPIVGTLYLCLLARVSAVILWDVPLRVAQTFVLDEVEELLWVIYPALGLWAEWATRRELGLSSHRADSARNVVADPVSAADEAPGPHPKPEAATC